LADQNAVSIQREPANDMQNGKVRQGSFMNSLCKHHISALLALAGSSLLTMAAVTAAGAQGLGPTLTSPAGSQKAVGTDGFIPRWLLLEPIPSAGLTEAIVRAAVKKEYFPNQFTVIPKDGDKVTVPAAQLPPPAPNGPNMKAPDTSDKELTWHAVETSLYNVNLYHFARALSKPTSNVLFWAVTIVNSPQEMRDVRLAIGSNAASVWWLNGQEVASIFGDRQTVIDDGVSKRLTLKKGDNILRAVIVNGGGATDFCARFLDTDDKPIKGLTVSLSEFRK
jgi:hypothetical protein